MGEGQASGFTHDPSLTGVFAALPTLDGIDLAKDDLRAVVIGGGTGAPVSIRTLLSMGIETSAVVAMADDGGSTGILRDEEKRAQMEKNMASLGVRDATERIYETVMSLVR